MRIAFIANIDKTDIGETGVKNKMEGVLRAFRSRGVQAHLFCLSGNSLVKDDDIVHTFSASRRYYVFTGFFPDILKELYKNQYDALWIRHGYFHPRCMKSLKRFKEKQPECRVLYEFPTYPVIHEFVGPAKIAAFLYMKILGRSSQGVLDGVVTYSGDENILGHRCISISNGVHAQSYPLAGRSQTNRLTLVAIGGLWPWYGLDRLIEGMKEDVKARPDTEVMLKIIGRGREEMRLKQRVEDLGLGGRVHFLGWKTKEEIDEVLREGGIGVGTLALFRKKVDRSASIKHREYAARGMRFFYAGVDEDFVGQSAFALSLEESDRPIDIERIRKFVRESKATPEEIRQFAERRLSWDDSAAKVLSFIQP